MRLEEVPNRLEVKLNDRNWILEFVVADNLWMQDTNGTNSFAFQEDVSSSFWEVLSVLFWISVLPKAEILALDCADLCHQETESAVDNFEGSGGV